MLAKTKKLEDSAKMTAIKVISPHKKPQKVKHQLHKVTNYNRTMPLPETSSFGI